MISCSTRAHIVSCSSCATHPLTHLDRLLHRILGPSEQPAHLGRPGPIDRGMELKYNPLDLGGGGTECSARTSITRERKS